MWAKRGRGQQYLKDELRRDLGAPLGRDGRLLHRQHPAPVAARHRRRHDRPPDVVHRFANLKKKREIGVEFDLKHLSALSLRVSMHHRGLRGFQHSRLLGLQRDVHTSVGWRR